jgi:CBS domain-containing protein
MTVNALMTRDPACCTPDTPIRDVAQMMVDHNCGEIPVVRGHDNRTLVGVVTDRDIVCRVVATGRDVREARADAAMSSPVVSVTPDIELADCLQLMEAHQIRRVPVIDANGACCGIVSQADIAVGAPTAETGELVREVSRPN